MELLSTISNLFSIRQNIPLPVHISYFEPMYYPIPDEITKKSRKSEVNEVFMSHLGIENFSNNVLRNIRVKLKSPLNYKPQINSNEKDRRIAYEYDEENLEIKLEKIDPNESIYINLYPQANNVASNFEPTIIIDDMLLTRRMKTIGFYRKNPSQFILMTFVLLLGASLLLSTLFPDKTREYFWQINPDAKLLDQAEERLGGFSCIRRIVENNSEREWLISKSLMPIELIYIENDVSNYEELMAKDKIVACLPLDVSTKN